MPDSSLPLRVVFLAAALLMGGASTAAADSVIEWNVKANEFVVEARLAPGQANRMMAILYTAVFEAANAVSRRYPAGMALLAAPPGTSADAAVAAVHRVVLARTLPAQQAAIDAAYASALARLPDGPGKAAGVALGEKAAQEVMAARAGDGAAGAVESYRPHAAPGRYVPTAAVAAPHWGLRKPWLMASPSQLRPQAPPDLKGERWARDYQEVRALGARDGSSRHAEQTEIARFWEATLPSVYHGVVRAVAERPGRDLTRNARLFAAVAQATDDAVIAVFDAKYHYGFWRPVTAIRNGDIDGNDATERDAAWLPLIDTPMHPEYPCAHCTVAGAVGAVLRAEIGSGPSPPLATTSYLLRGVRRTWDSIGAFEQEVSDARVYAGVHYRYSNEVGTALGRQVGELAASKLMR